MSTPQIVVMSVADLIPYAANSKTHPASQVDAIAASIRRFGFNDPIAVTAANVIVEGHGRLLAAQSLGMEEVPVLLLPDLTDEQADLYRIAHNKIALSSTFDFALLVDQLREITAETAQFADMGFSQSSVDTLFNMFAGENAPTSGAPTSAAGGPEHGVAGDQTNAGLDAEIIWDDKEQRDRWNAYVRHVESHAPEQTKGQALTHFFTDVLSGTRLPGTTAEATVAGSDPQNMDWMPS